MFRKIICFLILLFIAVICLADIPYNFNYQGKLYDETGLAVNGSREFTIYLMRNGTITENKWVQDVKIVNGIFSTVLTFEGTEVQDRNPFAYYASQIGDSFELEVWVEGQQLLPNKKFSAVPYAFFADRALKVVGGVVENTKIDVLDVEDTDVAWVRANNFRFGKNRGENGDIALQSIDVEELRINPNNDWSSIRIKAGNDVTFIEGDLNLPSNSTGACYWTGWVSYEVNCPNGQYMGSLEKTYDRHCNWHSGTKCRRRGHWWWRRWYCYSWGYCTYSWTQRIRVYCCKL